MRRRRFEGKARDVCVRGLLLAVLLAQGTAAFAQEVATEGDGDAPKPSTADPGTLKEGRSPVDLLNAPGLSRGVDSIIAEIRKREIALALREQRVAERERAAAEIETRLDDKAIGLDRIREEVENRISRWSSQGEDRVQQLANVYSAMPPQKAGKLLDQLDLDLSVEVVRHMKKKSSANVLGAMRSERALMISRRILMPLDPRTDAPAARAR